MIEGVDFGELYDDISILGSTYRQHDCIKTELCKNCTDRINCKNFQISPDLKDSTVRGMFREKVYFDTKQGRLVFDISDIELDVDNTDILFSKFLRRKVKYLLSECWEYIYMDGYNIIFVPKDDDEESKNFEVVDIGDMLARYDLYKEVPTIITNHSIHGQKYINRHVYRKLEIFRNW